MKTEDYRSAAARLNEFHKWYTKLAPKRTPHSMESYFEMAAKAFYKVGEAMKRLQEEINLGKSL